MRHHLVLAFVVLTYAWTWGVGVPAALAVHGVGTAHISAGALTLAGFAPTIVALCLFAVAGGRTALRDVGSRLFRVGRTPWWYAGAFVVPIASVGAALVVLPNVTAYVAGLGSWYTPLLMTLFLIPLTGFFEEVGWRGLMLDRLETRMSPLAASAVVALAWGPWHLPTYARLMPEGDRTAILVGWFLLGTFPLSTLFAWVYNRTGRRLLPVIVLHASVDASVGYFFARLPTGELRPFIAWSCALWVIAALVLWKEGSQLGRQIDFQIANRQETADATIER